MAINGNATADDYAKVEKILSNVGPVDHIEDTFSKLQTELSKFQSPEQSSYTVDFYRNATKNAKTSKATIVSLLLSTNYSY